MVGLGGLPGAALAGIAADLAVILLMVWDARRAAAQPVMALRRLPQRFHQHEEAQVGLELVNPGPQELHLIVRDPLHGSLAASTATHSLRLPSGTSTRRTVTLCPLQRGSVQLGAIHLRVRGPLGLAHHQREVPLEQTIRVLPQARLDGEDGLQLGRLLKSPQGAHRARRIGRSHSLAHLREYARGDTRRAIHWRASARRHRPVTRVTRRSDHQRVVLLVDAGRSMVAAADRRTRLDRMLAAVLGFARVAIRLRDSVTIVVYGAEIRQVVHIDPRTRRFAAAYEALHDIQARNEESAPSQAAAWVRAHAPKEATVVWCTALTDSAGTERLSMAVQSMARRHPTVLLNLLDTDLHRVARQRPETRLQAFEKASALARRSRLDSLSRSLRSSGVIVVQAPADRLLIGLVSRS